MTAIEQATQSIRRFNDAMEDSEEIDRLCKRGRSRTEAINQVHRIRRLQYAVERFTGTR